MEDPLVAVEPAPEMETKGGGVLDKLVDKPNVGEVATSAKLKKLLDGFEPFDDARRGVWERPGLLGSWHSLGLLGPRTLDARRLLMLF